MDFQRIKDRLRSLIAQHQGLLTVTQLAELFMTSPRNIEYWVVKHGLAAPVKLPADRPPAKRYWRADQVLEWIEMQERLALEGIDIQGVYERTGISPQRWAILVRNGDAPKPAGKVLGTGKGARMGVRLWWASEVDEWLKRTTGGFRLPRRSARA
jgi:hypothetical protein